MRLLFIFLILPMISHAAWDHFQFDITFFCYMKDRTTYNAKIQWSEKDVVSRSEMLARPMLLQPSTGRYSFTQAGAMDGDEIFSAGYRPVAFISHDCTDDKKAVELVLIIDRLCEIGHTCHYRIIKDITNAWGIENMTPANFQHDNLDDFPDFP